MQCFFFFQAEDGIRDKLVTGVQTCALPIWLGACLRPDIRRGAGSGRSNRSRVFAAFFAGFAMSRSMRFKRIAFPRLCHGHGRTVMAASAQADRIWLRASANRLPPLEKGRDGEGIATPSRALRAQPPPFRGRCSEPAARKYLRRGAQYGLVAAKYRTVCAEATETCPPCRSTI